MSERMTSIRLPDRTVVGIGEWGRKTHAEMVAKYRKRAEHLKREAEIILAASDEDFIVETYLGSIAQRNTMRVYPEEETTNDEP